MTNTPLPSIDVILQHIRYDPNVGKLFWLKRTKESHPSQSKLEAWNGKFANKEAGAKPDKDGYILVRLCGTLYRAHRLIWVILGNDLDGHIDHINGDRKDNRPENLRCVDRFQNQKNMRLSKRNKSGFVGVHWAQNISKWSATIYADNKHYNLGSFDKIEDAVASRKSAEVKLGFHVNHGN